VEQTKLWLQDAVNFYVILKKVWCDEVKDWK